jgi:hypothetical protein
MTTVLVACVSVNASLILFAEIARFRTAISGGLPAGVVISPIFEREVA